MALVSPAVAIETNPQTLDAVQHLEEKSNFMWSQYHLGLEKIFLSYHTMGRRYMLHILSKKEDNFYSQSMEKDKYFILKCFLSSYHLV